MGWGHTFQWITWTCGSHHGQTFVVLLLPLETLHKLPLALQQAEGPTEAGVKHMMNPCKNDNNVERSLRPPKSSSHHYVCYVIYVTCKKNCTHQGF